MGRVLGHMSGLWEINEKERVGDRLVFRAWHNSPVRPGKKKRREQKRKGEREKRREERGLLGWPKVERKKRRKGHTRPGQLI